MAWFPQVEAELPSIVVTARMGEKDIEAEVFVDGQAVPGALEGQPISLNPGRHTVRVAPKDLEAEDKAILLARGESGRRVNFTWVDPNAPAVVPGAGGTLAPAVPMVRPVQTHTWILAGVGVAGLLAGGALGTVGLLQKDELTCAPYCTDSEKSSVDSMFLGADIGYFAGGAFAVAALVTYLIRPEVPVSSLEDNGSEPPPDSEPAASGPRVRSLGLSASENRGFISLGGTF